MQKIKPVYVMREDGIGAQQMEVVLAGICTILKIAGQSQNIKVYNFGIWRLNDWLDGGLLVPYHSVDWYIDQGIKSSSRQGQVSGDAIMTNLWTEPWQETSPHYDVVVIWNDMYSGEEDNNFVIGLALPDTGTVISINRFLQLDLKLQLECIKTEIIHEVGHVFGLLPKDRKDNIEEKLGKHCTNTCVMRQGLRLPDDWVAMTHDRLRFGPFCQECQRDLRGYFLK
ncbi:MAG: hypothetical protein PHW01_02380 [Patescibacteria group bacterium]|nr:hypothetical protein [Patescibacteria group bacterium]